MKQLFDDPRIWTHITAALIVLSVAEWAAATAFGWVNSVAYVSHLSQLAIVISLIPWWQGTRIEKRQAEEDIPSAVVERIVADTEVEPDPGR